MLHQMLDANITEMSGEEMCSVKQVPKKLPILIILKGIAFSSGGID